MTRSDRRDAPQLERYRQESLLIALHAARLVLRRGWALESSPRCRARFVLLCTVVRHEADPAAARSPPDGRREHPPREHGRILGAGRDDCFLDVDGAAVFLGGCSKTSIYHQVERGRIRAHRLGGRLLFDPVELREDVERDG